MLSDLSTPFYVLFGAIFGAFLAYLRWPTIAFQVDKNRHNGLLVVDVLLSLSGQKQRGNFAPNFEFAIYFVWKRRYK
jgi:hypothetical protein